MIVMTCDVCKKEVNSIHSLNESYQENGIKEMCNTCMKSIQSQIDSYTDKMNRERNRFIKRHIQTLTK